MSIPRVSMRQLIEAGVHFGHNVRRWNPKMRPYIYGQRNKVHIIDLDQTMPLLVQALQAIRDTASRGGRFLMVGTKRQARDLLSAAAEECGEFHVSYRWLGGTLTNWATISQSIHRLKALEEQLAASESDLTKRETLGLSRKRDKLQRSLGGIREMKTLPQMVIILDTNIDRIAVKEALCCNIPVVGILDTNSDPAGVDWPIPGNDDSLRAISLYCNLVAGAILSGKTAYMQRGGYDIGAAESVPAEPVLSGSPQDAETPAGTGESGTGESGTGETEQ